MHEFDTEAMNTNMVIRICGVEYNYARSAALECFHDLEMLESLLSVYIEGSDISMINSANVGETVKLTDSATECLISAFQAAQISRGVIDVCMGEYFLKNKKDSTIAIKGEPRRGVFEFDAENYAIRKKYDGMIDLGAIGKGFAVDKIVDKLIDIWEVENAFITFGGSSIYAFGKPDGAESWIIRLGGEGGMEIPLNNAAVGASGVAVQGTHILDARTGTVPENQPYRTWAFAGSAAIADAMSTAFMILPLPEIKDICSEYNLSAAIQQTPDSPIEIIE